MQGFIEGKRKLDTLRISALAIFSVVIVEVTLGLLVNSLAIISDGLHALLDALTSIILIFAVKAAMKPPDDEHMYGHEKFETIGGLLGGVVLVGIAFFIFYEAAMRLIVNTHLTEGVEFVGFIGIAYALFISSMRVTVFRRTRHIESSSMKAGFYDAIADLGSTIIALLGFTLATFGFATGDAFASIFLGAMLTFLSFKLVKNSIMELSDTASKDLVEKTRKVILACEGVVKTENIKLRRVGSKVFIDASIQVPNAMGLEDSHSLASKIEVCLKDAFGNVDATIHVEPSDKEEKLEQVIKKLAFVESVKDVHDISAKFVDGKVYVTLHVQVNPDLSVEEAHKISEKIESKIRCEVESIENVTVHVEPASFSVPVIEFDEVLLEKIVRDSVRRIAEGLEVKQVVTYIVESKRYINIDCCFIKNEQIKEAHRVASLVEKETKERFVNSVVTVHIEPSKTS